MLRLFAGRPDHPLADAKEVRRIMAELEKQDSAAALDDITIWLESLSRADGIRPDQNLDLLFQFDAVAQTHVRRLAREYATRSHPDKRQDTQRWHLNRGFWMHLITAYEYQLKHTVAKEKGYESLTSQLGLLTSRLLHAQAARLKWDQFHYGPIPGEFWAATGNAFLAAVKAGVASKTLPLYTHPELLSSPQAEYLKLLLFQASSMDNLLPLEIELAEHLINHLLPSFIFGEKFRPDSVYWVDCARPLPPTRLASPPTPAPTLRFFSAGAALQTLQELLAQIKASNTVPAVLNLSGQYSIGSVLNVLEHFTLYWAAKPPMREHARHTVKSRLVVVKSFATAYRALMGEDVSEATESWVIDDVSQGGIGAQGHICANEKFGIGTWLAMQPEGGSNWLAGVVRRLSKESSVTGSVGIETVSKTPLAIHADSAGMTTTIILLDAYENTDSVRVALPKHAWEEDIALCFSAGKRDVRLHPLARMDDGSDFVIGRYRVEIQESLT